MAQSAGPTILIADDDKVMAQLVSGRLSGAGYRVVVAYDAMQTTILAMQLHPAAILLDLNMPGGTGLEVLKRLKSSSKTSLIPVLVLSGSIEASDEQTVLGLGAEHFFSKPPDFDRIQTCLSELLAAQP